MSELRGRVALVTGASRGIGRAAAERLSGAGCRLGLLARSGDTLEALARKLDGVPLSADVVRPEEVDRALLKLREATGRDPDLVVNAAGVFSLARVSDETVEGFDRQIAVNLRGAFVVTRRVLPVMLAAGAGTLVHIGSVAGRRAFPQNGAYSASKFGLRGFHEVLLEEIVGTGVRATLVEPAATDTPIWDPIDPDASPGLPDRAGMLDAEDVAEAILFAVSRPAHVRIPFLPVERA